MTIRDVLKARQVRELMHFTTNKGLVGVLHKGQLLSRKRLPEEIYLEHICTFNCDVRKDRAWLDYVNLSVSWINPKLFSISANNWHKDKDLWWCILSFDAAIAEDTGVVFATTNNMYSGVKHLSGGTGLEALFAPVIVPYVDFKTGRPVQSSTIHRPAELANHFPTDPQAEVLYPGSIGIDRLLRIYVPDDEYADRVASVTYTLLDREIETVVRPDLFSETSQRT